MAKPIMAEFGGGLTKSELGLEGDRELITLRQKAGGGGGGGRVRCLDQDLNPQILVQTPNPTPPPLPHPYLLSESDELSIQSFRQE